MNRRSNAELASNGWVSRLPPAMQYSGFRLWWLGNTAGVGGMAINQFTWLWLIHELTGSPLYLGYVGLAQSVPAISLIAFGGAIADKIDRRRLIMFTQSLTAVMILTLASATAIGIVEPWHIIVAAVISSTINAFDWPAREAFYPQLVDRGSMMSAVALDSTTNTGIRIIGPAVAGVVVATFGTAAAMYVAALGFAGMAVLVSRIHGVSNLEQSRGNPIHEVVEGFRFILGRSIFSVLIFMSFFISFFGGSYQILMPVFAVDVLNVGARGQGVLMSAGGFGALFITLWLGAQSETKRRGLLTIGSVGLFGLSVAAFGLTSELFGSYTLAIGLMFIIGLFQVTYSVLISSSVQLMVPDAMRGRVMGIHAMTYLLSPLGGMQAGAIANGIGAPYAAVIGGISVVGLALGPALFNSNIRNLSRLVREQRDNLKPQNDLRLTDI